jgi:5-methylcytosine-specific restriction endonuclease McrA
MIDDTIFAFPKPHKGKRQPAGLKQKTPLKSKTQLKANFKPIPKELKLKVLQEKGNLCFLGFCPNCGGQATVTEKDDFHHFPHKSRGGKDCVEHLWPCRRECHQFIHDNPLIEKEMFKEIIDKFKEKEVSNV